MNIADTIKSWNMSFADTIKGLIRKKPVDAELYEEPRQAEKEHAGGGREKAENPYLTARRTWNDHVGSLVTQLQTWQFIGIFSLTIALASVGGMIFYANQSKYIPYVIEVDKLGQTVAMGPVEAAAKADQRVIHAAVADWLTCARMVSPDLAIQRKCVFKVYSMLAPKDPATLQMNEWLNGTEESNPLKRAEKEMVSTEIKTVLLQTVDKVSGAGTWQVEWMETTRDRQGVLKQPSVNWQALITVYIADVTSSTTDEQLRNNPMSIYVRNFSWSRIVAGKGQ